MLSESRQSTRSPSESAQTDSVRAGPTNRLISRQSHQSSITEEDDIKSVPPAPPLPSNLRAQRKSSSTSSSSRSTPVQSTSKPYNGGTNAAKTSNDIAFLKATLRHDSPDEQSKYSKRNPNQTITPSESKRTMQTMFGRVSAQEIENEKPTSIFNSQSHGGKPNQSIFEKVDTHGGHTSYLGTGTFSQLENCIRNCLSHTQSHTDFTNHTTKYNSPQKSLTHASVLADYSYEGISSSNHHITHPTTSYHQFSHHTKPAAELSLNEIRQVNDALTKYGIPVLSQHEQPHSLHNRPRNVGDIISACHELLEDPLIRSHREGTHAVQHVWDNIHLHQPHTNMPGYGPPAANMPGYGPSATNMPGYASPTANMHGYASHGPDMHGYASHGPDMHGYASPALRGVTSHLFNPLHQTPYDPVHGVASHLFHHPQQSSYNPNHGYASPALRGVTSHLFNPTHQTPYDPVHGVASHLFHGQQPQHFTASPFSSSFNQYPGNNYHTY